MMSIHPSAVIDPKAELDTGVRVGPYCVIDGHVRIAAGCRLYQGVYVTGWTQIDEDCELHPGVIVGHEPQDTKYRGQRTYCRVGRGTVLREYVTIHRGTTEDSETVVGEDCFLLGGSHVAHNCQVGNRVTLINSVLLGGHVRVGDGATLGGNSVVHQFVRVGELAMIAGHARVIMDVLPFALTDVEGRVAGLNRIGLRRAGKTREEISEIREVYRILFGAGCAFSDSVGRLQRTPGSDLRNRIARFLEEKSTRGVAGRSRRIPRSGADQTDRGD